MAHRKSPINLPMALACVLLCLTLISINLTGGLYAKYTSSGSSPETARVIKFGDLTLTETGDFVEGGSTMMIVPGVDIQKKATVYFAGSEAATYVFVTVVLSSDWTPDSETAPKVFTLPIPGADGIPGMSWTVADGWSFLQKGIGNDYVYYLELAPNEKLEGRDIIKDGRVTVSDGITRFQIDAMTGITVTFRAAVVQSGGFESADAAWESLSKKG